MSVQRYRFYANNRDLRELRPEADGDVVKFIDHQSSLAEREQRIAQLEEHIRTLCECLESDPEMAFDYTHQIREARAALAATEGEKR